MLTRLAPEVHWCSLHNCECSGNFGKKIYKFEWQVQNLQFSVSTFSEKIALGVKMGEPGTVRILLTEGLHQRLVLAGEVRQMIMARS